VQQVRIVFRTYWHTRRRPDAHCDVADNRRAMAAVPGLPNSFKDISVQLARGLLTTPARDEVSLVPTAFLWLRSTLMAGPDLTQQFLQSMPPAYRAAFTLRDAEEHARIVFERGNEPARVVVWRTLPQGTAVLCVVADDRPGLVALVSAAFVAHGLDVRSAQIYCRERTDGGCDAVDFFWLRGMAGGAPVEPLRLDECARTIRKLVAAEGAAVAVPEPGAQRKDGTIGVRYAEDPTMPGFWELSVDAQDFPGLLHGIARLLHQLGLEVVRSEVRTDDGVAHDQFVLTAEVPEQIPARLSEFERALIDLVSGSGKPGSNGKAPALPDKPSEAKPRRTRLFGNNKSKPRS
jgi:UTP:GlnB (protein PII) uridylyltransferase